MLSTLLLSLALGAGSAAPQSYAVHAKKLVDRGGNVVEDATLWIEGGKIRAVGKSVSVPNGTPVIEHAGTVTAGLIAGHDYAGVVAEAEDDTRPVLADAKIADAFDARSHDFERLLASGVTAITLAPYTNQLVAGSTAVVKCAGGEVLNDRAQLQISLTSAANRINREPTSPSGALAMLREELREGRGTMGIVAAGRLPVLIAAQERHEIARAVAFAREHRLKGALLYAPLAGELAQDIHDAELGVIFAPIAFGTERRVLRSVAAASRAQIPIAFALESPYVHGDVLRVSAAACVREGLERASALRALTSDPAKIAGVEKRIGALEPGMDADFLLWSGDPLELSTALVAVYIDGVLRHGAVK